MIDLTLNTKDRDSFITKLYLKEDSNSFIVRYASGRLEEQIFSIHNFNMMLHKMEEQFLQYREEYVKYNARLQSKMHAEKLIEALLGLLGVYFIANIPVPEFIKMLLAAILFLASLYFQTTRSHVINHCCDYLNTVNIASEFIEMKEKFKIKITDPVSGLEEDWYLLTLSGIEEIYSIAELKNLTKIITPEVVEGEKEKTQNELQRIMSL